VRGQGISVSRLISLAFQSAQAKNSELWERWIRISAIVGSALPAASLMTHIQRDGYIDVLIRSLEDEFDSNNNDLFQLYHLRILSDYWVGSMYEIFRLLNERKLIQAVDEFNRILRALELVRVSIEKHEIPKDRVLKAPLRMGRFPERGDDSDEYLYIPDDKKRAHIVPSGVSAGGSIMWQVIDLKSNSTEWVERRTLSDQIIAFWGREV
jgi:hypothetical protein